jgi:hypothetical protein
LPNVAAAMRGEMQALNPTLAVFSEKTMEEHLSDTVVLPKVEATVLASSDCRFAAGDSGFVWDNGLFGKQRDTGDRDSAGTGSNA